MVCFKGPTHIFNSSFCSLLSFCVYICMCVCTQPYTHTYTCVQQASSVILVLLCELFSLLRNRVFLLYGVSLKESFTQLLQVPPLPIISYLCDQHRSPFYSPGIPDFYWMCFLESQIEEIFFPLNLHPLFC